jgi:hypothetical protein
MMLKRNARLRRWREGQRRPVQGNSPNDRILRGPDCYRPKRICADPFPATPSPDSPKSLQLPGVRFLRQAESIAPMERSNLEVGCRLPLVGPQAPVQERDGRSAPCSSSAMSSGRLFLDRVARQHCPSPLHRRRQNNTHPSEPQAKGDISTLPGTRHFYFALTK